MSRPYSSDFDALVTKAPPIQKKKVSISSINSAMKPKPISREVSRMKIKQFKKPGNYPIEKFNRKEKKQTQQQTILLQTPTAQYEEIMRLKSLTHLLEQDLKLSAQEIRTLQHVPTILLFLIILDNHSTRESIDIDLNNTISLSITPTIPLNRNPNPTPKNQTA